MQAANENDWAQQGSMLIAARNAKARHRPQHYGPVSQPKLTILTYANEKWYSTRITVVKKALPNPPRNRFTFAEARKRGRISCLGR